MNVPNVKKPTIGMVAAQAGVAVSTVSRFLNGNRGKGNPSPSLHRQCPVNGKKVQ